MMMAKCHDCHGHMGIGISSCLSDCDCPANQAKRLEKEMEKETEKEQGK